MALPCFGTPCIVTAVPFEVLHCKGALCGAAECCESSHMEAQPAAPCAAGQVGAHQTHQMGAAEPESSHMERSFA